MNFKKLFDWKFDKKRVREVRRNWKNKKFEELLDRHIINYEIECDDYDEDLLKNHIPLLGEAISNYSMRLYRVLESTIILSGGGMGGVSFRHTIEDVTKLLKREGFKYKFVKEFVFDFENRLYEQYNHEANKE